MMAWWRVWSWSLALSLGSAAVASAQGMRVKVNSTHLVIEKDESAQKTVGDAVRNELKRRFPYWFHSADVNATFELSVIFVDRQNSLIQLRLRDETGETRPWEERMVGVSYTLQGEAWKKPVMEALAGLLDKNREEIEKSLSGIPLGKQVSGIPAQLPSHWFRVFLKLNWDVRDADRTSQNKFDIEVEATDRSLTLRSFGTGKVEPTGVQVEVQKCSFGGEEDFQDVKENKVGVSIVRAKNFYWRAWGPRRWGTSVAR